MELLWSVIPLQADVTFYFKKIKKHQFHTTESWEMQANNQLQSTLIKRKEMRCVFVEYCRNKGKFLCYFWSGHSWTLTVDQSQASALPMSAFSPVAESPEPVPLVSKGHRLCERWRWSDWAQANCSHLGDHSLVWASIATSLPAMCKDKGTHLSFSSPGIFMRNPWVYSTCNGPLESRNTAAQQHLQCFLLVFFPLLLSHSVRETSCSKNLWRENTSN